MNFNSLPPGKELETLACLSEGMEPLFENCDLVSPDSNFILCGIGGFYNYGVQSLAQYGRMFNSKYFELEDLFNMYVDISSGQNTRIDKKELRNAVDENFLRVDVILDYLLTQALPRDHFLVTEQAYHEIGNVCARIKKQIEQKLEQKNKISPKHFRKRYAPPSMRKGDFTKGLLLTNRGYGKTIRYLNEECATEIREILKELGTRIDAINEIRSNVYENRKILLSNERFSPLVDDGDIIIINTALDHGERVGIISSDKDFERKIPEIMQSRKRDRLLNPHVFLLAPKRGLLGYDLMEYSNEDFSSRYLKRA